MIIKREQLKVGTKIKYRDKPEIYTIKQIADDVGMVWLSIPGRVMEYCELLDDLLSTNVDNFIEWINYDPSDVKNIDFNIQGKYYL